MRNEIIVQKIIACAKKVIGYCEHASDINDFIGNSLIVEACVFNLGQIGELTSKLDDLYTERRTEIPWRAMYGLRNRIVHDYDGVNMDLIWQIIKDDLPALIEKLEICNSIHPHPKTEGL